MNKQKHILIVDPIAFGGGSKIATNFILKQLSNDQVTFTVVTQDCNSWQGAHFNHAKLWQIPAFSQSEQGLAYFIRHIILAFSIIMARIKFGKVDLAIGASGPGVDLSLYLAKCLLVFPIIQLIHGPVAQSKTVARCLIKAKTTYYLTTARNSIHSALSLIMDDQSVMRIINSDKFQTMQNGLPKTCWPSICQYQQANVFWAASLLKWKGLDTFVDAIKMIDIDVRPQTHICYIKPKQINQPLAAKPTEIARVNWHQTPINLDDIRAGCNIFVSTSTKEPFGLSILEALAAGHCVLIPSDGAYWDQVLEHNFDCIKYDPGNAKQLANLLQHLSQDINLVARIGIQGQRLAQLYRAEQQYELIQKQISSILFGGVDTPALASKSSIF